MSQENCFALLLLLSLNHMQDVSSFGRSGNFTVPSLDLWLGHITNPCQNDTVLAHLYGNR